MWGEWGDTNQGKKLQKGKSVEKHGGTMLQFVLHGTGPYGGNVMCEGGKGVEVSYREISVFKDIQH